MSPRKYARGGATPSTGPKPIPAGKYLMEIKSVSFGKSKTSGFDMVTAKAAPVDGEFSGQKVPFYVVMFPAGHKSLGQTLHFLSTIGEPWQGPAGDEDNYEVDETRWVGRRFYGMVDTEMFNGNPQNKIKSFLPIEGEQPPVPEPDEVPF